MKVHKKYHKKSTHYVLEDQKSSRDRLDVDNLMAMFLIRRDRTGKVIILEEKYVMAIL